VKGKFTIIRYFIYVLGVPHQSHWLGALPLYTFIRSVPDLHTNSA